MIHRKKKNPDAGPELQPESDGITPWLFWLPSLLCVSVLVLLPFADVDAPILFLGKGGQFVGFKNYIAVFQK